VCDGVQHHYKYLQMYYRYFWGPDRQSPSTKFWFLVFCAIVKTAVMEEGSENEDEEHSDEGWDIESEDLDEEEEECTHVHQ